MKELCGMWAIPGATLWVKNILISTSPRLLLQMAVPAVLDIIIGSPWKMSCYTFPAATQHKLIKLSYHMIMEKYEDDSHYQFP